jgi:branched-subunit amino acid transport protein AzlD
MLKEIMSHRDHVLEQHFIPDLITHNPPAHYCENDFYFSFPSELNRLHLLWDTTSGVGDRHADGLDGPDDPISPEMELRILIDKSLRSPLTLKQQHVLTTQLAESPTCVLDAGLTPQAFPDLVEQSPMLAIEVLRALIHTDRFTEYLTVLVNMEMSVHSMEVVKLLTAEVDLPTDLIVLYLCNCMSTCEQNKDQYTQNRLVRLFCVFLQSLVKNNTIHLEDISIELQCFCIQFCAFKEVSALYRMLKNKDKGEDVPSTSGQLSLDCGTKDNNSSNSNLSSPSG